MRESFVNDADIDGACRRVSGYAEIALPLHQWKHSMSWRAPVNESTHRGNVFAIGPAVRVISMYTSHYESGVRESNECR
jgi:hypothetical protein